MEINVCLVRDAGNVNTFTVNQGVVRFTMNCQISKILISIDQLDCYTE